MNWSTNFTMLFPGPLRIDFGNKSKSVVDSIDESTKLLNTFTYDDDTSMFENNNYAKDDMVTISRSDIDAETLGEICRNEGPYDQYLRLTRLENVALLTSYFSVGFALTFLSTPLNYYMITSLDASSADIGVLATVQSLPWSFKVFYGLLSDTVPIFDYRRKPYLIIGWTLYVFTNFSLAACQTPGIVSSITGSFLMTVALLLAEVATDTLCVERAKLETIHMKGNLQVTGFTYRAFGRILGASLGSVVYNQGDWGWGLSIGQIFMVNGVIPAALVLTAIVPLVELASDRPLPTFREQLQDIWSTLQLRAVWSPNIFIYIYNIMQIPNSAWYSFLVEGLDFSSWNLGILTISASVMTWLGLLAYKRYFFQTSWRLIYIGTTCLGVIFSLMQLLLVYGVNAKMGIPDVVFALGDTTIESFVAALHYMPKCVMYVCICPEGSEGTTFALLTTISNLGATVASDFGSWLTNLWDTSNTTLEAGNFSGIAKLTILTSFLQFLPIFLVGFLPATKEEQQKLQTEGGSQFWGGFVLACVATASLAFTVVLNVYILAS